MAVSVVVGAQWGDEGKGKIVDCLASQYDMVARYQGGANAGHTIYWNDQSHVLHLLPSGVFTPDVKCVIGNGVVIDPQALVAEIAAVQELGVDLRGRLFVSRNAHCILPYHRAIEEARSADRIGTTRRGIGPAYVDKAGRTGIRMADLADSDDSAIRLLSVARTYNRILERVYERKPLDAEAIVDQQLEFGRMLAPFMANTSAMLHEALHNGSSILAEGAQGSLLDIDFGTYPFVTSSSPTAGGACTGLGIPPKAIDRVVGIAKAYCTRVGNGPFPTELTGAVGEFMQREGAEFGATTGRPRRCGWLDLVALRYACNLNGFTELALTKLDVLTGLSEVKVCTAYTHKSRTGDVFDNDARVLEQVRPHYESLPGWEVNIRDVECYADLPEHARGLVDAVVDYTGVPVQIVSTGPKRVHTLWVDP